MLPTPAAIIERLHAQHGRVQAGPHDHPVRVVGRSVGEGQMTAAAVAGCHPGEGGITVLTGTQDEHVGGIDGEDVRCEMTPPGWCPAGSVVFGETVWCSVCGDFGDGCAGGGFVDDGLVGAEPGDEGL